MPTIVITEEDKKQILEALRNLDSNDLLKYRSIKEFLQSKFDPISYLIQPSIITSTARLAGRFCRQMFGKDYKEMRTEAIEEFIKENSNMPRKEIAEKCGLHVSTINHIFYRLGIKSNRPKSLSHMDNERMLRAKIRGIKTKLCAVIQKSSDGKLISYRKVDINRIEFLTKEGKVGLEVEILPEFSLNPEFQEKKELLYGTDLSPEERKTLEKQKLELNLMISQIIDEYLED